MPYQKALIVLSRYFIVINMAQTITIPKDEYDMLKKKEEIADDVILQLSQSLDDMKKGRIKKSS